jgi:hypothetical protein
MQQARSGAREGGTVGVQLSSILLEPNIKGKLNFLMNEI